jgi:tryptophan synthase alpha subunit
MGGGVTTQADAARAARAGARAVAVGAALVERLEAGLPLAPFVRELCGEVVT